MRKAHEILDAAATTYREKNAVYGDSYLRVGAALAALFPDGVTLKTADDFNRFHIFALMVVKQSRYCVNWESGGHQDSVHDNTVYSAILEEIDEAIADREALEEEEMRARSDHQKPFDPMDEGWDDFPTTTPPWTKPVPAPEKLRSWNGTPEGETLP